MLRVKRLPSLLLLPRVFSSFRQNKSTIHRKNVFLLATILVCVCKRRADLHERDNMCTYIGRDSIRYAKIDSERLAPFSFHTQVLLARRMERGCSSLRQCSQSGQRRIVDVKQQRYAQRISGEAK